MRSWEQATWQTGQQEQAVMARVGRIVAQRAAGLTGSGDRILALAGRGHNGDDVRMALPHLAGRDVDLLNVNDPARQLPELARALEQQPQLIIDGLFGIGLNRPLDKDWKAFIGRINQAEVPVLAVDAPSGLNCDSGEPEGAAIVAAVTLTLGAVKRGLLASPAVPHVGRLELAGDIGLCACPIESDLQWIEPADFAGFPPRRQPDAHKGDFGHLVIIAGSLGFHGAAVLAARGAQAAQPGLISVITTDEAYVPVAAQLQSAMVRPWTSDFELPDKATAVLFGPGLADATVPTGLRKLAVRCWGEFPGPVVADASGLEWIAGNQSNSKGLRVVTPHPGEAARLLNTSSRQVQADRVAGARKLAESFGGAWVVLKGHQTLVGGVAGPMFVNSSGNARLAQGGSGDVLAGFLAGWLAQPTLQRDASQAIRYAVWRHGYAGESAEWSGLIDELPRALVKPFAVRG